MIVVKQNEVVMEDLVDLKPGTPFTCNNEEYIRIATILAAAMEDGSSLQNIVGVSLSTGNYLCTSFDEESKPYRIVSVLDAEVVVK